MAGLIVTLFAAYLVTRPTLRGWLLIGFSIRLLLILVHVAIAPLPLSDADAMGFEEKGLRIAESWSMGYESPVAIKGANVFAGWVAGWYYLFGHIPFLPLLLNAVMGVALAWIVYKIALDMTDSKKVAKTSLLFMLFFPNLILNSTLLLREMFVLFFAVLSFWFFLKWYRTQKFRNWLIALLTLGVSATFHGGMIFVGLVYGIAYILHNPKKAVPGFRVLFGLVMVAGTAYLYFNNFSNKLPTESLDVETLANGTMSASRSRAAYLTGWHPSSMFETILQTPVRVIYFMFTPFPWMVRSVQDLMGLLDSITYLVLTRYFVTGMKSLRQVDRKLWWIVLGITLFTVIIFAWGVSNYGTAMRHRLKLVWLILPIAFLGWQQVKLRHKMRRTRTPLAALQKNSV